MEPGLVPGEKAPREVFSNEIVPSEVVAREVVPSEVVSRKESGLSIRPKRLADFVVSPWPEQHGDQHENRSLKVMDISASEPRMLPRRPYIDTEPLAIIDTESADDETRVMKTPRLGEGVTKMTRVGGRTIEASRKREGKWPRTRSRKPDLNDPLCLRSMS